MICLKNPKNRRPNKMVKKRLHNSYLNYFSSAQRLKNNLEIILENLKLIMGLDKEDIKNLPEYKVHLAVDFADLMPYLYPDIYLRREKPDQHEFKKRMLICECLFSDFFENKLILLPPYQIEAWDFIYLERKRAKKAYDYLIGSQVLNFKDWASSELNNDDIRSIVENIGNDTEISNSQRKQILLHMKEHFTDLFNLAVIAISDPHTLLQSLLKNKLVFLSEAELDIDLDDEETIRNSDDYLSMITKLRSSNEYKRRSSSSSYYDALALSYVEEINKYFKNNNRKEVVLLLTRSTNVLEVAEESERKVELENYRSNFAVDSELFLTYLQFCKTKIPEIDTYETVKYAAYLLSEYVRHKDGFEKLKNGKHDKSVENIIKWANDKLPEIDKTLRDWTNLEFISKDEKLLREIHEKFLNKTNTMLEKTNSILNERLKRVLYIFFKIAQDSEQKIGDQIEDLKEHLMSVMGTGRGELCRFFLHLYPFNKSRTTGTGYMLEFNDPRVADIYNTIVTDIKAQRDQINDQVAILCEILSDLNEPNEEAQLLYCYFLAKEKNAEKEALRNINFFSQRIKDQKIIDKYLFIKNMILARNEKTVPQAMKNAGEMISRNNDEPRYYIQKAYFLWKYPNYKQQESLIEEDENPEMLLSKAIEKAKEPERNNIIRVALCDLMTISLQNEEYDKTQKHYDELQKIKKLNADGPAYYFADGLHLWAYARIEENFEKKRNLLNDAYENIKTANDKFPNDFYKSMMDRVLSEKENM